MGYLLFASYLRRQRIPSRMPRIIAVLPVGAAEEEYMDQVIQIFRSFPMHENRQRWVLQTLNHLESRGLIIFDEAAWAAMEAYHQGP
ncbi:hypothetical protein N7456_003019 [Penicillium angulare]|uniref:Uncharacterized protein n=1 Tax=Penicillium angulare TaxID=116970 RepID=A0A9W9FTY9_9EURO|nr:hypothetical protein N7456_003019 [Penicillium angulare]